MSRQGWITVETCGVCGSSRSQKVSQVRDIDVVRCIGCDTVRITEVVPPDVVYSDGYHLGETWGDDQDPRFDYTADESIEYEMFHCVKRLEWLERFVAPSKLIDVGGGVGTFALAASQRGWDATLLEPVPSAVEYAREAGVKAEIGGVDELEGLSGKWDVASLVHVLEHFEDPRDALTKVAGALAPGGYVFIELPNWGSVPRMVSGQRWVGWRPGQHIHLFTRKTLAGVLERAGFEPISVKSVVLLWDGLIPDYYAYLVGGGGVLRKMVDMKRKLARRRTVSEGGSIPEQMPPSLKDQPGKRALLKPIVDLAARIEGMTGVGENIRAVARLRQ